MHITKCVGIMMAMMNLNLNACHMYNPTFWLVLTITTNDMGFKETKYQRYEVLDDRAHEASQCCTT